MKHHPSFLDQVEAYFKARPLRWIGARELETVGGRQAWRTRVSECRTRRGMTIENQVRRVVLSDAQGRRVVDPVALSEYRYVPPQQATFRDGAR